MPDSQPLRDQPNSEQCPQCGQPGCMVDDDCLACGAVASNISHIEVPEKNFPERVGPGSFSPEMLRAAAEQHNASPIHPAMEIKPWVVLTLLDAVDERKHLAHALYTVWMHAGQPTEGIIAARVRGALEVCPELEKYEQLAVLR